MDYTKTITDTITAWKSIFDVQQVYLDNVTRAINATAQMMIPLPVSYPAVRPNRTHQPNSADRFIADRRPDVRPDPLPKEIAEDQVIDVGEEVLQVGKGRIAGATTRVRRVVNHVPVEQTIELYDETVRIERIPLDSDAGTAEALQECAYEMQDVREVPIVLKRLHLRERVVLHRERHGRIETVRETVKQTAIEVEQPRRMPAVAPAPEATAAEHHTTEHHTTEHHAAEDHAIAGN